MTTPLQRDLLEELSGFGEPDALASVVGEVLSRYDEDHRHYHTRAHLQVMLRAVRGEVVGLPGCPRALRPAVALALLFHDAVYDPEGSGNEEASAELAGELLHSLELPASLVEEVVRLVLLTATHEVGDGDVAGAALVDADLAVLAGTPPEYERYRQQVRREYAAFDDELWAAGRRRVLSSLLSRPILSPRAAPALEARVRVNLTAELASLRPDEEIAAR